MDYEFKGKKSNMLQDVLVIVLVFGLFVLNPIFDLVSEGKAFMFAIVFMLLYVLCGNMKTVKKTWKNKSAAKFFDAFNNPSSGELVIGIALILFGNTVLRLLGFDFPDILTSIFFIFYILRTMLKSSR